MDSARQALKETAARRGHSLLALSRLLGHNDAYLQQFVSRGSPRRLAERDRAILADYLGVDEEALGGPPHGATEVAIRRFDVAASAGPGRFADDDRPAAVELFPEAMLRRHSLAASALTLITARGDSMAPTIADGDDILVDTGERRLGRTAAIYVLRIDGVVLVKRLRLIGGRVRVISDNPRAAPIAPLDPADADVIGKVVWLGRKLR